MSENPITFDEAIEVLIKKMPGNLKPSKYLTAKQAEKEFKINSKTLLIRSTLPPNNLRYIPAVKLKGGRKKYFERKVLERLV